MNLRDMNYGELTKHVTEAIRELRLKAYDEGYEQGKFDAAMDSAIEKYDGALRKMAGETPQEKRDRIIEKAKKDIETLQQTGKIRTIRGIDGLFHTFYPNEYDYVDFVINKQKRTVVALIKRKFDDVVWAKGIAKCAPSDCFNVHIGKAIALRRALGLEVPDEYLNAPQPTEVRVGDVVYLKTSDLRIPYTRIISKVSNDYITYTNSGVDSIKHVYKNGKVIGDSREEATK